MPLARLERGALLAPDGTRVELPAPPPRFQAAAKGGGQGLSSAFGGGGAESDDDGASDAEAEAPPRGRTVHRARDAPPKAQKRGK